MTRGLKRKIVAEGCCRAENRSDMAVREVNKNAGLKIRWFRNVCEVPVSSVRSRVWRPDEKSSRGCRAIFQLSVSSRLMWIYRIILPPREREERRNGLCIYHRRYMWRLKYIEAWACRAPFEILVDITEFYDSIIRDITFSILERVIVTKDFQFYNVCKILYSPQV